MKNTFVLKNTLRVFAVVACLLMPLILNSTVLAIPQPDDTPSVYNIHVNRNLVDTGDTLIYGQYHLPYTSPPTTPADETFMFRLIDTDNVTELGTVTPHPFFHYGYKYGAFSMYFASSVTWGSAYTIRISENPSQFDTPTSFDYIMALTDYTSKTTQADNQEELADNIISIAETLESIYPTYDLIESGTAGKVLSDSDGEKYFRGVIPGLQAMSPDLFLIQVATVDTTARTWATTQATTYEQRMDATWVGPAANTTASQFGMTPQMMLGSIAILPLCIGAIFVSTRRFKKADPGFLVCAVLLIMGLVMGWMPAPIVASLFQAMGIYISYLIFLQRG